MKDCKFKVGDKVMCTYQSEQEGELEYGKIYTVDYIELVDTEWILGIKEDITYRKWQWKFELAKNQIIKDIIKDL